MLKGTVDNHLASVNLSHISMAESIMQDNNTISTLNLEFSDVLACSFHDIKNSLELLSITLESLSESIPDYPKKKDHVTCVQYEVLRISNTLTYMLTIYKMENQQFTLDLNHNSVFELIEETYYKYLFFTQNRGITMEIACPEELMWYFDKNLVSIILDEIINNTCRYTHSKLLVSASADDDYMTLTVEDDGQGYPDVLVQIFCQPTPELDTIQLKGYRTGLGMYFAKTVVESHTNKTGNTGYIELSNEGSLGGGRFSLVLPV